MADTETRELFGIRATFHKVSKVIALGPIFVRDIFFVTLYRLCINFKKISKMKKNLISFFITNIKKKDLQLPRFLPTDCT